MLYFLALRLLYLPARLAFRLRFKGLENIPKDGNYIVCSNHKSVIDPYFIAMPFKKQVRFMAKQELFTDHGKLSAWFLRRFGAFPVHRDSADADSIKNAIHILEDGGIMGIFAQGGCVRKNIPFKAKAGVALIAAKAKAPILPACIYCEGNVRAFSRITVRFGRMIPYEELGFTDGSLKECRNAAAVISKHVNALLEEKF